MRSNGPNFIKRAAECVGILGLTLGVVACGGSTVSTQKRYTTADGIEQVDTRDKLGYTIYIGRNHRGLISVDGLGAGKDIGVRVEGMVCAATTLTGAVTVDTEKDGETILPTASSAAFIDGINKDSGVCADRSLNPQDIPRLVNTIPKMSVLLTSVVR